MYPLALLRQMVRHFGELAGYEGERPFVTQDINVYERIRRRRNSNVTADEDQDYGICLPARPPVIWINPKTNNTFARLSRTCAHEALHAARPDFPHGPFFDKAVQRLLKGKEP